MRNRFNEFLILLAQDHALREAFGRDADAVLSNADLSEGEKAILKSRRGDLIRSATFRKSKGSLTVVGTGISLVAHMTWESRRCIEEADRVLHACAERATAQWVESLNPRSESLDLVYRPGLPRIATYRETVERILACVRDGLRTCVVFYGHPGVFVYASHESIRRARIEGYSAQMLPAISAEDCLFADLGVDPGDHGYQGFEATDFLIRRRKFDPTASLVLWQIGAIGELGYKQAPNVRGLETLIEYLAPHYGTEHGTTVYEAAQFPITDPLIQPVQLGRILEARITAYATLYIPPLSEPARRDELATTWQGPV